MERLEAELFALGGELDYPPTPDIAAAVAGRLSAADAPAPRRRRSLIAAIAAALLLLGAGTVAAVAPARDAVLEFLHLRGATVEQRRIPGPAVGIDLSAADLGSPVTLAEARRRVDFDVLVPAAAGTPDSAFLDSAVPGGQVGLVYPGDPAMIVMEFRGDAAPDRIRKLTFAGTRIEELRVGSDRAVWVEGKPHRIVLRAPGGGTVTRRVEGGVLFVERGPVLVRIQGAGSRERALEIARSLR